MTPEEIGLLPVSASGFIERPTRMGEVISRMDGRDQYTSAPHDGITLRQLYAGQAMRGILANPARCVPGASESIGPEQFARLTAKVSCEFADALLAELAKAQP